MKLLLIILTVLLSLPQGKASIKNETDEIGITVKPNSEETIGATAKIIKLLHHIDNVIDGKFHIRTIADTRNFKHNIGVAHRYLDRPLVVPLYLHNGFMGELEKACNRWRPKKEESQGIKMKIVEIYLWDYLHLKKEKRYAKVTVEFNNEENESLGIFTALVSEKGKYVRFSHERRLEKAIWDCINQFAKQYRQVKKKKTTYSFQEGRRKSPPYGAAYNFLDLKNQDLKVTRPILEKTIPPNLFRYRPKSQKDLKLEYYAYWLNGDTYIKATNYANTGAYYVKVLEKGKYWFMIDKINIQSLSKDLFNESNQELSNVTIGILIDSENGVPNFITDDFLEELIAPYPDLAERYLIVDILNHPFQLERVRRLIAEINQRIELK